MSDVTKWHANALLRNKREDAETKKTKKPLALSFLLPLPRLQLDTRALHPHPFALVRARFPHRDHVGSGLRHLVLVEAPQAHERGLGDDRLQGRGQHVGAVVRVAELERQRGAVRGQGGAVADADDAELDVEALGDALWLLRVVGWRGEREVGVERRERSGLRGERGRG